MLNSYQFSKQEYTIFNSFLPRSGCVQQTHILGLVYAELQTSRKYGRWPTKKRYERMNPTIIIRDETSEDASAIKNVTIAAFKTLAISQHTEQFIIEALRAAKALTLSLVAEIITTIGHPLCCLHSSPALLSWPLKTASFKARSHHDLSPIHPHQP